MVCFFDKKQIPLQHPDIILVYSDTSSQFMKKRFLLFALALYLFSCNPVRKTLEGGSIKQTSFTEKIPFTFDSGLPIIKVEINGKHYNFLFDTGAPTVISPELQQLLQLKPKAVGKTSDSQGNTNQQAFVKIPLLKIGSLQFENIGASVIDMKKVFEFKCMDFDGIIGANQMEKAIWQIDYRNLVITASNTISNFDIPKQAEILNFIPKAGQMTPRVAVKIGNQIASTTFDTGAATDFSLPYQIYKSEVASINGVEAIGSSSSGIFGASKNATTTYKKVPSLAIGNIEIKNQIVAFNEGTTAIIGNSFLKNYRLVLSWKENKIYLIKELENQNEKLETYGIGLRYVNLKPTIVKIFKGTEAEKAGLLINDQIIAVDDKSTSNLTQAEACNYTFNNILNGKETRSITILRNGEKLVFNLKKTVLLN